MRRRGDFGADPVVGHHRVFQRMFAYQSVIQPQSTAFGARLVLPLTVAHRRSLTGFYSVM